MVLKFIDAYLDLHGEINAKIITDQFGLHRSTASALMTKYRDIRPGNTRFKVGKNVHERTYIFEKTILKTSSFEYLNAIELAFAQPESLVMKQISILEQ